MFLKVFRAYVRFDPCEAKFVAAFEDWKFEYVFLDPNEGMFNIES